LKQFESLALWESEEALARCLYNQGILALMRDRYYHNVGEFFHITLPEPELEDEARIDDLVTAMVGSDGLLGEDALWEAYQLRRKFYGNSTTHVEVLKCLLPLVRAYNQQGEKHQQVINLLEPVVAELESKQEQTSASRVTTEDKSEWLAKCLNLLAEAEDQAEKHEQAEKHRLKALHVRLMALCVRKCAPSGRLHLNASLRAHCADTQENTRPACLRDGAGPAQPGRELCRAGALPRG
jgi:hypothetical protein